MRRCNTNLGKGKRSPDANIDLGLAISALSMKYGDTRTYQEIAFFCGVTDHAIRKIGEKALRKLRHPERLKLLRV